MDWVKKCNFTRYHLERKRSVCLRGPVGESVLEKSPLILRRKDGAYVGKHPFTEAPWEIQIHLF